MGQPEGRLARLVIKEIEERGGFAWKVHGDAYTPSGLPDVIGTYMGVFIGVETKMPGNDLSVAQVYRIRKIREAGGLVLAPCRDLGALKTFLDLIGKASFDEKAGAQLQKFYGRLNRGGDKASETAPPEYDQA